MNRTLPLVTIGVASYNNSKYIIETLESINNQTYPNIQLIIIDDCSSDSSRKEIETWLPSSVFQVTFHINAINQGITKVCNLMLDRAAPNAKYFCLFGSDDVMDRERISRQVEFFETQEEGTAAVFSDMTVIDENSKRVYKSYVSNILSETSESIQSLLEAKKQSQLEFCIRKNIFAAPTVLYRKKVLQALNGWDEKLYFEDWDMNLKIIAAGYQFKFQPNTFVAYRMLSQSLSRSPNPFYWSSILKSVYKYRGINASINDNIHHKIIELAPKIFEHGGSDSLKWLLIKLRFTRDRKTLQLVMKAFVNKLKLKFYA